MNKKLQFTRAILKRSSLAMAMLAVLVATGTLLSGTSAASAQANTPATGAPIINGTAQASETLTADTSGIADGDGFYRATFSYQWISNNGSTDTDIADETNSTYVIKPWDLGNHIKVRVSFTDKAGNQETLTSAATAAVEASPNEAATGGPIIYGMAEVGQSLGVYTFSDQGLWIMSIQDGNGTVHDTYSYQWIRSDGTTDSDIPDATGSSYTLTDDDEGKKIKVRVSFTDDGANHEALTSYASSAVTARPSASELREPTAASSTWSQGEEKGIELSWTAPEGTITGYQILREEGYAFINIGVWEPYPYGCTPLMEVHVDNTGSDATTYTDTDVAESAVYTYSVRAINDDGVGRISRPARGLQYRPRHTPTGSYWPYGPPGTPRHAPTNLASIQIENGIELTWDWDASEGEVTGYQILRRTPEQCEFAYRVYVENTNSAVTRWVDRDVEADTLYEYHIRAINDVGVGSLDRSSSTSLRPAVLVVGPEPNNLATGVPTITGAAQVGETLTADTSGIADEDGLENVSYSYQWLTSRDAEIDGATSSTYSLQESDEGKVIKVRVTFTDDVGHEESLTSAPTAAVAANSNSPATGVPTINGTAQVGQTLTVSTSGVSDTDGLANATFTYRWISNDGSTVSDISGAMDTTYTLVEADEGKAIKVRVSFTDDRGNQETLTSAATGAVAAAPSPLTSTIHNVPSSHNGQNAFAFELRFSEQFPLSYKTLRDHAFTVTGGEVTGARRLERPGNIRWEITVRPSSDAAVTIVLPVTEDCEADGAICTEDGRKLSGGLLLVVTGPNSPATGLPSITGTAQVGETLTAGVTGISDSDGLNSATFAYQWLADDVEINEATANSYTLTDTEAGKAIKVQVSFNDDAGNEESVTSAATAAVAAAPPPPNTPATGAPAITGAAQVGETLTADTTGIADDDGLGNATFSYQWLADNAEINGANASTYTLVAADVGKAIKVKVSFADDAGNDEQLASAATGAVTAAAVVNPPLTASARNVPSSHDGSSTFTFVLRFSEELVSDFSYVTMRDHAFTVTGGSVTYVRRLGPPSNTGWEIHVTPDSNGSLIIVLPVTGDCGAQGAICTEDGRLLSNRLQFTINGSGQ